MDDNEQIGGNEVAIEESCERLASNDIIVEGFGKEQRYPMREQRPLGEWWKNHIFPQHDEERVNVATIEDPLSWSEGIRHNMKNLISDVRNALFDYSQSGSVESEALDYS